MDEKYENLANKSISIIEWIYMHCNRAKFILKVDDDMFLNTGNLEILRRFIFANSSHKAIDEFLRFKFLRIVIGAKNKKHSNIKCQYTDMHNVS